MVAQDPFIITSEHRQNMEVAQKRPNTPFLADGRDPGPLPTMAGALPHLPSFWIRCIKDAILGGMMSLQILIPLEPQHVTLFGNRVFVDVIS